METEKEIISAYSEFTKVLKKLGVKNTLRELKSLASNNVLSIYEDDLKNQIIKITCRVFMVNSNELMKSSISDTAKDARTVCLLQLKEHLTMTNEEIARIFMKTPAIVSHAKSDLNNRNEEFKPDKKFMEKYKMVSAEVATLKEKMYERNND